MSDDTLAPICFRCTHYLGVVPGLGYTCTAFAGRQIPIEIIVSSADHRYPYAGDGGVTFEPVHEDFDVSLSLRGKRNINEKPAAVLTSPGDDSPEQRTSALAEPPRATKAEVQYEDQARNPD
jgi:hypothetical protein